MSWTALADLANFAAAAIFGGSAVLSRGGQSWPARAILYWAEEEVLQDEGRGAIVQKPRIDLHDHDLPVPPEYGDTVTFANGDAWVLTEVLAHSDRIYKCGARAA